MHGKLRNCEEKGLSRHEIVKAKQKEKRESRERTTRTNSNTGTWIRKRTMPEIFKPKKKL